jgi:hypothetical protein
VPSAYHPPRFSPGVKLSTKPGPCLFKRANFLLNDPTQLGFVVSSVHLAADHALSAKRPGRLAPASTHFRYEAPTQASRRP